MMKEKGFQCFSMFSIVFLKKSHHLRAGGRQHLRSVEQQRGQRRGDLEVDIVVLLKKC